MIILSDLIPRIARRFGYAPVTGFKHDPASNTFFPFNRQPAASGINVNNDVALKIATVFACVSAISEDIAKVPFVVYQKRQSTRGKDRRDDHPAHKLLHDKPNPLQTAIVFRQAITASAMTWGNGYAFIERDVFERPIALWPLSPAMTKPKIEKDGRLVYEVKTAAGGCEKFSPLDILHIMGLGFNGFVGMNVIEYARECLGAAMATEIFGASFFGNGTTPSGMLEHPNNLSKEAQDRLTAAVARVHGGPASSHKLMVLEEGMKFAPNTIPPDSAQFLGTRQFSIPEICRWFRCPPHKAMDFTRATFNNVAAVSVNYVVDTLLTWYTRWEQAADDKLFTDAEKADGFIAKHTVAGLLRGDPKQRNESFRMGRQWGWLSANDVRELEDMNPLPGDQGDIYMIPMNMNNAADPQPRTTSTPGGVGSQAAAITDAAHRIAAAEIRSLENRLQHAAADRDRFNAWVDHWIENKHATYTRMMVETIEGIPDPQRVTTAICDDIRGQLDTATAIGVPIENILDTWATTRTVQITQTITNELEAIKCLST